MADKEQLEGLKQIADWCKWLVTIETAAVAAIGAFLKVEVGMQLSLLFRIACSGSLFAFVASIVLSAWLMVSVPTSIQDIGQNEKIWDRPAILFNVSWPFWKLAYTQMALFVFGVIAFAIGAVGRLWL